MYSSLTAMSLMISIVLGMTLFWDAADAHPDTERLLQPTTLFLVD